jgi:hypothetical protein
MNIAEILRGLTDIVDGAPAAQQPVVININNGESDASAIAPEHEGPTEADGVMIPPLQQKIELMKKMAGEESAYDPVDDEISIIKQNAGLKHVVIAADEDEPFEG